jgi:hypothetical protein
MDKRYKLEIEYVAVNAHLHTLIVFYTVCNANALPVCWKVTPRYLYDFMFFC